DAGRDYVHVDDVILALTKMMQSPARFRGDIFNICSGKGYSPKEIYREILKISGLSIEPGFRNPETFWDAYPQLFAGKFPLSRDRIKKEVFKHSIGDPGKTKSEFGWETKISLSSGLASVYEYARQRIPK